MADFIGKALNPFGLSDKLTNHLSGGPPQKSYMGGSQEALDAQRGELGGMGQAASQTGAGYTSQGVGMLGQAGAQAGYDRGAAYGMMGSGMQLGQSGTAQQSGAVRNMIEQARAETPSMAQAQLQMGLNQTQQAMLGQAAQARGGNQAAAMRGAQMAGANMALQTNQQAAILRAQEAQQRQQNILGAYGAASSAYGQQAGMGYGLAGQGLGAAQQSTGMLGQFGNQVGGLGVGQQNVGLGAYGLLNDLNKTQLDADRGNASATAIAGSPAATFGSILGGVTQIWGGGGGGRSSGG